MTQANPTVVEFLKTRRSRPAKTLTTPVPNADELMDLLTIASRTPDHGKLEPWRFIVIEQDQMARLSALTDEIAQELGYDASKTLKGRSQFDSGNLIVAVVFSPKEHVSIPQIEQLYTAGGVCLALLNGALASGWGANWLSGWVSHNARFCQEGLGLSEEEKIAGLIHIGTETKTPPERPRPDVATLVSWAGK